MSRFKIAVKIAVVLRISQLMYAALQIVVVTMWINHNIVLVLLKKKLYYNIVYDNLISHCFFIIS
jgi:hypothetical protein